MASGTGLLKEIEVTPVVDTAAYASGDVLWTVSVELASVFQNRGPASHRSASNVALNSISVLQETGSAFDFDIVFLRSNVSLGTVNIAVSISDIDAREVVGFASLASATDSIALVGSTFYAKEGNAIQMQGVAGDTSLYVAGIARGAVTFTTAADFKLRIGLTQD